MKYSLLFAICLLVASCKNQQNPNSTNTATKTGFKDYSSFPVGGAVSINKILIDDKLRSIAETNFNSITATNDMKLYNIMPKENIKNYHRIDSLVAFTTRNDMRLFGHTLVWHVGLPKWIEENQTKLGNEWAENFLHDYIQEVVTRYKGKVEAWDVVNEAFESSGGAYRNTFWREQIGPDYIEKAFTWAHEADPNCKLFYNDFNIERDAEKLDGVLKMVKELQNKGVPIHGIGFQMHLRMDIDDDIIAESLKKAAQTGLLIHISELDIIFNKHDDSKGGGIQKITEMTPELLQDQADKYENIVNIYKENVPPNQRYGITFWDFTDRDTWIKGFFDLEDWPTVFDENLDPKPAYYGFKKGLESKK